MTESSQDSKITIINAVKTPLAFIVLGFLIVDGAVTSLTIALPTYRLLLIWVIILSVPLYVAIVVWLAIWRPEALRGDRPLHKVHAEQFASDLFIALDGSLRNLQPEEHIEAWTTLADVILNNQQDDPTISMFRATVAAKLRIITNIHNRRQHRIGLLEL